VTLLSALLACKQDRLPPIEGETVATQKSAEPVKSAEPEEPEAISNPRLGTLVRKAGKLTIGSEVTRLRRVAAEKGDIPNSFGVCFLYSHGERLRDVEVVVRPPAKPKTLRLEPNAQLKGKVIHLPIPALRNSGEFCQDMYFDSDDPLGTWVFELRQGAEQHRSWVVEVYQA
jgi:hypothetical protein